MILYTAWSLRYEHEWARSTRSPQVELNHADGHLYGSSGIRHLDIRNLLFPPCVPLHSASAHIILLHSTDAFFYFKPHPMFALERNLEMAALSLIVVFLLPTSALS